MGWLNLGVYSFTAALTISGILVSVYPPEKPNTKAFAIFLIVILGTGVGALSFVQRQEDERLSTRRDEQLSNMKRDLDKQTEQIKELLALNSLPKQSENIAQLLTAIDQKVSADHAKGQSLRQRARGVSSGILRLLLERSRGEPPLPRADTWSQDVDRSLHYMQETMGMYSLNFAPKVMALRTEFAERGLTDPELNSFCEHPTNPLGMRIVGERLGALAERIPDE